MKNSNKKPIIVTTLGTGTPILNPNLASQSILVEVAGYKLLFDTGRNVIYSQLLQPVYFGLPSLGLR
jgi:ribonuclease BN (tRNA processing enzyme)